MNTRRLLLIAALVAPVARAGGDDLLDQLPPWSYSELVAAAKAELVESEVRSVRLLAWQTQEDGRPVRFDSALIWLHLSLRNVGERWALVMLSRDPLETNGGALVKSFQGHSWHPVKAFDAPPCNRDVYAFLDGHWDFEVKPSAVRADRLVDGSFIPVIYAGFRILRGRVRDRTWKAAIGEAPLKFHRQESGRR